MSRILFVVWTLLALAGCATSNNLVDTRTAPKGGTGYVAGHFTLDHYPFVTAFLLTNAASGAEYILPFTARRNFDDGNDETTLIEVPPGTYRIKQWIVFNVNAGPLKGWGRDFTADMKDSILTRPFEVKPGEVVFAGSFEGSTTWTPGLTSVTRGRWTARRVTLDEARQSVASSFANFSQAPVSCVACVK